jgi:hypothetical protein
MSGQVFIGAAVIGFKVRFQNRRKLTNVVQFH